LLVVAVEAQHLLLVQVVARVALEQVQVFLLQAALLTQSQLALVVQVAQQVGVTPVLTVVTQYLALLHLLVAEVVAEVAEVLLVSQVALAVAEIMLLVQVAQEILLQLLQAKATTVERVQHSLVYTAVVVAVEQEVLVKTERQLTEVMVVLGLFHQLLVQVTTMLAGVVALRLHNHKLLAPDALE
jgi:hypothetical protein